MAPRIAEWYKRLRHTHGYGVHSPFAYRIVRNVICPSKGYMYYGEEQLLNAHPTDADTQAACMLLRLSAEMRINYAFVQPCCPQVFREGLESGNPKLQYLTWDMDLEGISIHCLDDPYEDDEYIDLLEQILERAEGAILWLRNLSENDKSRLFRALREGVMFHGPSSALIIQRAGMQPVSYSVRI